MRKVVVKNISNLTGQERRSCYNMSFGKGGDLYWWLKYPDSPKDKVVLVKDDDKIVGWGIRQNSTGEVGFWTKTTHRRQGIGTKMVTRLGKVGPLIVKPHDDTAELFFAANNQSHADEEDYPSWSEDIKRLRKQMNEV